MAAGKRAVFVDRDGVLNRELGGYVTRPDDLELLPGVGAAIARLNHAGWLVIVFTNQAGVGRGYFSEQTMEAIHVCLREQIAHEGGELFAIYACPHHPDAGCECRKPLPGMLLQAARDHRLDLNECYAVGDTPRDIHAAHVAGCRAILVLTGHTCAFDPSEFPAPHPDQVCMDLSAAVDVILNA